MSQSYILRLTEQVKPKRSEVIAMNERFYELPEEKQHSVLNAAMEVFATNDYKRASTDLIAAKSGVSKGLLFYYFHNKKELYLAVYEYARRVITEGVADSRLLEITDFFDLISYAAMKKIGIMIENPYILDFAVRSFYSEKEEVSDALKATNSNAVEEIYGQYFRNIDFSKFRDGADPYYLLRMLIWMTDGYLHEQQMYRRSLCLADIEKELVKWTKLLKQIAYREKYL